MPRKIKSLLKNLYNLEVLLGRQSKEEATKKRSASQIWSRRTETDEIEMLDMKLQEVTGNPVHRDGEDSDVESKLSVTAAVSSSYYSNGTTSYSTNLDKVRESAVPSKPSTQLTAAQQHSISRLSNALQDDSDDESNDK
jgi:hypothetical protein